MTLVPRKLALELGACEDDAVPTEPRELELEPAACEDEAIP